MTSPILSQAAPATDSQAGSVQFTIDPAQSEARYVAREQLAANTIQNDAIGRTRDVSGQIIVDPSGQIASGSRITVGLQTLTSDRSQRDNFIKRNTLQTDQFPTADFLPRDSQGLSLPVPTAGQVAFTLLGDLTVHGATRSISWDVGATFGESDVTGQARTVVRLDDFGMPKPQVPIVASIEDDIRLELDFSATRNP